MSLLSLASPMHILQTRVSFLPFAYLCLDTSTTRLYTSRHVRFVESIFPFVTSHTSLPRATSSTISEWCSMTLPVNKFKMVCYECPTSLPLINSPMLLPNLLLVLSLTHSRPRLDLLHGRPSCGDMIRIYNQVEKVKGENQGISTFEYL
ncbi:hypothetical protein AAG906_013052 [Vitis piasezkii]